MLSLPIFQDEKNIKFNSDNRVFSSFPVSENLYSRCYTNNFEKRREDHVGEADSSQNQELQCKSPTVQVLTGLLIFRAEVCICSLFPVIRMSIKFLRLVISIRKSSLNYSRMASSVTS